MNFKLKLQITNYKLQITNFKIAILVEMFQKEVESKLEPWIGRTQLAVHIGEGALWIHQYQGKQNK